MNDRFDVIHCKITKVNWHEAVSGVLARVKSKQGGYVCFANVHACVTAYNNPDYLGVLNQSFMTFPDGKPIYWFGRVKGIRNIQQIPGPDFFSVLLSQVVNPPLRHYFYGGRPDVLQQLIENLKSRYPHMVIAGWESPPFRELSPNEDSQVINRIQKSMADIIWIGLGAPKQDLWMATHYAQLRPAVLLGVGAAFDFHAGNIKRAPLWVRTIGLEWLHRLMQEPRRLWKRYVVTNTLFLIYALKSLFSK